MCTSLYHIVILKKQHMVGFKLSMGTKDVKKYKINILTKEHVIFCTEPGESVSSKKMRFSHIANKL